MNHAPQYPLSPTQSRVLAVLKPYCVPRMKAPGNKAIAREAECSPGAAVASIAELRKRGLLKVEYDADPNSAALCHRRFVDVETGKRSDWGVSRDARKHYQFGPDASMKATKAGIARMATARFEDAEPAEVRAVDGAAFRLPPKPSPYIPQRSVMADL